MAFRYLFQEISRERRRRGQAARAGRAHGRRDRKLCLTAALVGAASRKELAAAFRRVDPATPFDLERAHKWLQGRALPRDCRVYEDWARLVDLGEGADWIAARRAEAFLERLCTRHALARKTLLRRTTRFGGAAAGRRGAADLRASELVGSYVCYSHAWSSYFRGRLIRGTLAIIGGSGAQRLLATYTEALPTGQIRPWRSAPSTSICASRAAASGSCSGCFRRRRRPACWPVS